MLRAGVLAGGGGTNLQALIDRYEAGELGGVEISFVLSDKSDAYALKRAEKHGIRQIVVDKKALGSGFEAELISAIDREAPDLLVLAGLMIMIPAELCRKYKNRIINIHPSLIPSFCGKGYYGLKVHEAVLAKGVRVTGATVHFVDEIYDNGPIILQKSVEVRQDDTPEILQKRVMQEAEWIILPEAVRLIGEGRVSVQDGKVYISPEAEG